ncbi:hypothetical protein QFZ27_002550 [Inquilinus ginsengisoli]|uniref:hypothetical protein n=1 Tax=Inquilinus ginsengisoli TaxID=363840 RepID=UPI003D234778
MLCFDFRFVFLGIAVLMLAGCGTSNDRQVRRMLDQYVGKTEAVAILNFGRPVSRVSLPDGQNRTTFVRSRNVETGGFYVSIPRTEAAEGTIRDDDGNVRSYSETRTTYVDGPWVSPREIEVSCTIIFQIDAEGRIRSYDYVEKDTGEPLLRGFDCARALGASS